jgi:hypothetical protein
MLAAVALKVEQSKTTPYRTVGVYRKERRIPKTTAVNGPVIRSIYDYINQMTNGKENVNV